MVGALRPSRLSRPRRRGGKLPPAARLAGLAAALVLVGALAGLLAPAGGEPGAGAPSPGGSASSAEAPAPQGTGGGSAPAGAAGGLSREFPSAGSLLDANARALLLMDAATGQVLAERNADEAVPLASVTKLMTLRLVFKALHDGTLSLGQEVTVPEAAVADLPAGSSRMWLAAGDRVTVRDLLYGAAVGSGNDACLVLARAVAGSTEEFVKRMNDEASVLGLGTAVFADPHGLSPDNRMSARDLAILARSYLHDYPEALGYHATRSFAYHGVTLKNFNGLLGAYPGADGLKTGHTGEAGFNLVGTAKRGGYRLIVVVLGVPDQADFAAAMAYRESVAASLLDWGFTTFSEVRAVLGEGGAVGKVEVYKGTVRRVPLVAAGELAASVPKGSEGRVVVELHLGRPYLVAPVAEGQPVGTAAVTLDGREVTRVGVVAGADVPSGGFWRVAWDSVRLAWAWFRRPAPPAPPAVEVVPATPPEGPGL